MSHRHIDYLMLMMVEPDVRFRVIPRDEGPRSDAGLTRAAAIRLDRARLARLAGELTAGCTLPVQ